MEKFLALCLLLFCLPIANADYLTPTTNLSALKRQIVAYHHSGAYTYDVEQVAVHAEQYLERRVNENKRLQQPKKLAVVLDIDETALSNYSNEQFLGFGGTMKMIDSAEARGNDSAIVSTLALYRYAVSHGVAVFFVTGRREPDRVVTIKNLADVGYRSVENSQGHCESTPVSPECLLYLRAGKYLRSSAIPYKTAMRQKIEQAGYDIVVNMGDQYSDLAGGYSDHVYKYPNYMYYVP